METLRDVLIRQLRDLYSAEIQLVRALPKAAEACVTAELRAAIERHLSETKNHVKRLDKLAAHFGEKLSSTGCEAMKGLIEEATEIINDGYDFDELRDAMLVAIGKKIEHYEIAAYGTALALAEHLALQEVSSLLHATLEEEKSADRALTEISTGYIYPVCDQEFEASAVMDNESLRTRS
jgi:ferritin-like metal-binding protein YciE